MERLKELRNAAGYTQEEVAKALGVSRPAYTRYENGEREPDYTMLKLIAEYFHVKIDYLLGRNDDNAPSGSVKPDQNDINLDELEFALFGEVRELNDEEKEELLRMARRMRELDELRKEKGTGKDRD